MIIRKPYAFLIKNFKKLHIILLILSLFIYYKTIKLNGFVSEFASLGVYNEILDPVSNYVSILFYIAVILSIIGAVTLILLLKYKGKPWKLYMVPFVEYVILFFIMILTTGFFNSYTDTSTSMDVRLIRDVIFIMTLVQFPIFVIYIIRIIGVDLNKFNFKLDEEYLDMNEEDREELEISLNIDYHAFIRLFNRTKRNIKYFYCEHKKICNLIITILLVVLVYNGYKTFGVEQKKYKQGDVYNANGYTMVIKDAYYTDKDAAGKIIEKDKAFVIVKLTIKNNYARRTLKLDNFHVLNGTNNYGQKSKLYSEYFKDYGKTDDITKELSYEESTDTTLIFKVNKKDKVNKFVLCYQEISGFETYLRKIKLKINDVSNIAEIEEKELGESFEIKTDEIEDNIAIDNTSVHTEIKYTRRECTREKCEVREKTLIAKEEQKILKIEFSSEAIDGREFVDFLTKYGTIIYEDNKNRTQELEIKNAVEKNYFGKEAYILIPDKLINSKNPYIKIVVRNKQYKYKLDLEV